MENRQRQAARLLIGRIDDVVPMLCLHFERKRYRFVAVKEGDIK